MTSFGYQYAFNGAINLYNLVKLAIDVVFSTMVVLSVCKIIQLSLKSVVGNSSTLFKMEEAF